MTIHLRPDQEKSIRDAIRAGAVGSVDEFISAAIDALPRGTAGFDPERARLAGNRIRQLRRGVRLDRGEMSIRELAHLGHRY